LGAAKVNLWGIIPLVSSIVFATLFVLVLQRAKKRTDRIFAIFLFASAIWGFTSFMLVFNPNASTEYLIFWNGLVIAAIPWAAISYYHFVRTYNNRPAGIGVYIGYTVVITNLIFNLSGFVVQDASLVNGYLYHDIRNWDLMLSAVLAPFIFLALYMLVQRYRHSTDPVDRNRTMYLITGWVVLMLFGYITPLTPALAGLTTDHFGNLGNALIIAYAITRLRLLDTMLVARRGLSYFILSGIIIGIYIGIIFLGLELLPEESTASVVLAASALALMLAILARPLRQAIEERIDRIFYRQTYAHRQELLGFSTTMGNILNLEELAQAMLPAMTNALNISKTALLFRDSANADFIIRFVYPEEGENDDVGFKLSADSPIVDWLDMKDKSLNPEHIDSIAALKGLWQVEKEQVLNSGLGLLQPIKSQGKLIGILALGSKEGSKIYSHDDIQLVASIANQAGIIIENAHLYTQATTRANTDGLTGLFNHRHFHQRLEQEIARATRFGTTFSMIMLDLDLFKAYNDIYGHLAGDQILRRIGLAIESSIRSVDTAFRYGGEEFTVILPETRLDDAFQVSERIRKTIESKTSFREMPVTASLGIANWPGDGMMKEEIIGRADAALYRAKQTGRNRTCLTSEIAKAEASPGGKESGEQPKALSVVYALAATVDAKDHYTYGHSRKVSEYAVALAEGAGISQDRIDAIRSAGLLHDIGKLGIPDSILSKPGALDDSEWGPIKSHPELGVEILKRVADLAKCLPAVLHHHEYYNGNGYPAGLKGDNIPLEARILAVADAYDAITSPRPYHSQLTSQQALEELQRCAGTQFDPELVTIFTEIVKPATESILSTNINPSSEDEPKHED
jgi:diguanylate cyclase (GGDEF)-like protein